MNYIFKISLGFAHYSDAVLAIFSSTVLAYMAGNLNFVTPSPTLIAMQLLHDNFMAAVSAAASGGVILVAQKNLAKADLIAGLRLLALYVEANGQNSPIIMLGSGFLITGGPKSDRPLGATPLIWGVSDGTHSGSFVVKISSVDYALMYELRYTSDPFGPDARWNLVPPITSTTFTVEGVEEGTKIWIQVRSLNTKGQSEWSDPAYFMVR